MKVTTSRREWCRGILRFEAARVGFLLEGNLEDLVSLKTRPADQQKPYYNIHHQQV